MNKKTMTLEQYNKKYRNRTEYLIKLKKSEADAYNKKFEHVVGNQYLFNGRKWQLIGDTYYQIPRPISYTWFRNLHAGVQVATCALLGAIVVGGAATPLILNYLNGDYIVVDSKEVIFTYSKDDAGNINANIKTIDNTYEIKSIVVKTSDYEFIKNQDYTYNVESGDIYIKSESIKEHQGKIHVVPAVTAVQAESVDCERTLLINYGGSKPASDLHVKYYPENTHDKSINDYDLDENAPFEIVANTNGKYTLKAKDGVSGTAKLTLYTGSDNAKVETFCYVTVLKQDESYTNYLNFTQNADGVNWDVTLKDDISSAPSNLVIPDYNPNDPTNGKVVGINLNSQHMAGLTNFKTITLPSSLKTIGNMAFYGWSNLEAVNFDGTSSLITIGDMAFFNCSSIDWFKISNSLTSIGNNAFYNCSKLKFALDGESNSFSISNDKTILFDKNKTQIISSPSISGDVDLSIYPSLSKLSRGAFQGNRVITSIKLPKMIKEIPTLCFNMCTSLKSILCPNDSILEVIETNAFSECKSLSSITFPSSLKTIKSSAFSINTGTGITKVAFADASKQWKLTKDTTVVDPYSNISSNLESTEAAQCATDLKTTYKDYIWERKD